MNEEQLVIEIKRGRVGMRQVVDEDMMRGEPDREQRLKWLFGNVTRPLRSTNSRRSQRMSCRAKPE